MRLKPGDFFNYIIKNKTHYTCYVIDEFRAMILKRSSAMSGKIGSIYSFGFNHELFQYCAKINPSQELQLIVNKYLAKLL